MIGDSLNADVKMTPHVQTDEEKFLSLMHEWKVPVEFNDTDKIHRSYIIESGAPNGPVEGYAGFWTVYTFDLDGKFIAIGIWE